ncbi:MAG: hypothetical protein WC900_03275 [Oscillospiraceae bacterium]|jgi:hypothetical protein
MLKRYKSAIWFQKRNVIAAFLTCLILFTQQAIFYFRLKSGSVVEGRTYDGLIVYFSVFFVVFSFGMTFRLLLGLGVSRRTAFFSNMTVILLVCLMFAVFNSLIFRFILSYYDNPNFRMGIENRYFSNKINDITLSIIRHETSEKGAFGGVTAEMFAWSFSLLTMFSSMAYAVRIFIYRLSSRGKKLFFASMAAAVIFISSCLYLISKKTDAISKAISYLLFDNALRSSVSYTVIAIIMFTTAYFLIRRAPLKYKEE